MRPPPWLGSGTLARDVALAGASLAGGLALYALDWQPQIHRDAGLPTTLFLPPLLAMCVAVGLRRVAPAPAWPPAPWHWSWTSRSAAPWGRS